ncbi:MAG: serpin family protein [Acidimicrobiia bacterium]|nr:serpin family protein [Acidimicrobiia bacterium]
MMNTRLLAALLALALVAAACGETDGSPPTTPSPGTTPTTADPGNRTEAFNPGDVARISLPRATPTLTDAEIAAVVAADAEFGLDLFEIIAADDNTMISPYSIATALSMLYPGARGTTAEEIAGVLHLSVDDATLHAVRNHIDTALTTPPPPLSDSDTREPFTIRPANSAWGQGGYPFLDDYLSILATDYGAGLRLLDYVGDPEGSRAIINQWVEDATEDRISDLIPEGAITVDTRLALVNAIWFYANWFEQFDPALTANGSFTLLDGSELLVPLMHASLRTGYSETELFAAVRLPYAGDAAMVVLLPNSGSPADLAAALEPADLDIAWGDHLVDLTMPSFEFEAEVALKPALQKLGMNKAFEHPSADGADLTGITAARELYVSDAFHKTFIALDEEGTEAAAATAIIVSTESAPQPATFTADRPFLFWIEHASTGEMLFLGQVVDPA